MSTYAKKQTPSQQPLSFRQSKSTSNKADFEDDVDTFQAQAKLPFAHDFSAIPVSRPVTTTIQAKLNINVPGDACEQEADNLAEQALQKPDHQSLPLVRNQSQSKPQSNDAVSPEISEKIMAAKGGGNPMDARTRTFMENRFGSDFSKVKIHTDDNAVQLSRKIDAQAFTVGNDLFFDAGKYSPQSHSGKRLLSHELAHTMQQNAAIIQRQPKHQPSHSFGDASAAEQSDVYEQIRIIGEVNLPYQVKDNNPALRAKPDKDILVDRKLIAAEKLGDLRNQGAILTLVAVLEDKVPGVAQFDPMNKSLIVATAAEALGKIGGPQAVAALTPLLNSTDLQKRKIATVAFKHMRGKDVATELLARINKESDPDVKTDIIIGLGDVGQDLGNTPETRLAVDELIKNLSTLKTATKTISLNQLKWQRINTIKALGKLRDKRATADLTKAIYDWRSDPGVLKNGMEALGLIADPAAVDSIDIWLRLSPDSSVRLAAAEALGKTGGKQALAKLQKRLESKQETDPKVLQAIKSALQIP
jgi:HEAT repeat protein